MASRFAPPPLVIRPLGTVSTVTVQVVPDATLQRLGLLQAASTATHSLPARFYQGSDWQLTHASPTTGALVAWNWAYRAWFREGGALTTYKLFDSQLLHTLAAVFTRLQLTHVESDLGNSEDYVVTAATGQEKAPVPSLFYYTNQAGDEQYLALYSKHSLNYPTNPDGVNQVSVYEIVQVQLDADALQRRLSIAQQAGIRERRRIEG